MENDDKTYMWLIVSAFIALLVATAFAGLELAELTADGQEKTETLF